MYILGLTTMGDAAACLIKDGEIVAAAEEERFSRVKHHVGFPHQAVEYVLAEAGITLKEVAHVGVYWKPWVLGRRVAVTLQSLLRSRAGFGARTRRGAHQVTGPYLEMFKVRSILERRHGGGNYRLHYLDHHHCHAASAFLVSPFERAAVLTVDGTGEDTTTLFAVAEGNRIRDLHRVHLPHSLGQFFSAVTNFLGFDMFGGDEWKVMGLAGWGEPEYLDYFLKEVIVPVGRNDFRLNTRLLDHHLAKQYRFSSEFMKAVGPNRRPEEELSPAHRNIAASAQRALEEIVLRMLDWLHDETGCENLCLAGGVAFNSVMNGRVMCESPFRNYYIQAAAGDAGCALGACYLIWNSILGRPRRFVMEHAYWGPGFSDEDCLRALEGSGLEYERLHDDALAEQVARRLADGNMVAWFQGRMEWGPRALGSRSFLADPRDPHAREKLNSQVKLREWFRPLAPSMLAEASESIFGSPRYDPFMVTVFPVVATMKSQIPAVVHVDGTARPQTVREDINPRYWKLLKEFERLAGVPCLLNTSFNIQEPIVCTPADAVNTFRRSRVGCLALQNYLVLRGPAPEAATSAATECASPVGPLAG